ncbi:MAG: trypsin-like peptidase domain-containing protein [Bacilli bacterium]
MEKIEVSNKNNKNKKSKINIKKLLIYLLVIIIVFLLGIGLTCLYNANNKKVITKKITISKTVVTEEAMENAIEKAYDSVLCIEVISDEGQNLSTGTGFIYNKDDKYGYVLTNAHVVNGGSHVQGLLSNNKTVDLTLLGLDTYSDIAVLRMKASEVLSVASIGTSQNSKLGNTVFTIGSPMGSTYAGTVTKGILAGKDRIIEINNEFSESYIVKVLQTDAAINPGNSGGPLVNLAGDVIGITSLKLVDSQIEAMGFAIPIEEAMNYVNILEKGEKIQRPLMGIQVIDMTNKYLLYRYGIEVNDKIDAGIIIRTVNSGYPAEKAGLKVGDIITKIDEKKVTTTAEFRYELYKYKVGDNAEITFYRDNKEIKTKVTLNKPSK